MADLRLARPWDAIRSVCVTAGILYQMKETRSPRNFFAVDETAHYVVRVQERDGNCVFTRTFAPARSPSVAAYEKDFC